MVYKPAKPSAKPTPSYIRKGNNAVGKMIKPKKDTAVGRVLTPGEALKEQGKKNSRAKKGYKGNTRI